MKILGIIPARGGSKGVKNKNIRLLNGKPLISYTLESALKSQIDKIVVTTDSDKIAEISSKHEVGILRRSAELSSDKTPMLPVILDVINRQKQKFDLVMTLQPTSPLRTHIHIDESIRIFSDHLNADSLVSIVEVPHNFSPESIMFIKNNFLKNYIENDSAPLMRQEKKVYVARNGPAILINKIDILLKQNSFYNNKTIFYKMSKISSIDIDDYDDFEIASAVLK